MNGFDQEGGEFLFKLEMWLRTNMWELKLICLPVPVQIEDSKRRTNGEAVHQEVRVEMPFFLLYYELQICGVVI